MSGTHHRPGPGTTPGRHPSISVNRASKGVACVDVHGRSPTYGSVKDSVDHHRQVREIFERIAGVYDFMNHLLSLNFDRRWRRSLARQLDADAWEVLDLCSGTGDLALTCARAGKGRCYLAADFCPEMLAVSRGKPGHKLLQSTVADALQLPLRDWSVDAVVVAFGMRNLADVRRGLAEMTRVLRPSGQLLVLEFFRNDPSSSGEMRGAVQPVRALLNRLVPLLGRAVARDQAAYRYLSSSMSQFQSVGEFASLLQEYGYGEVFVVRQTLGIAHLIGGRRPA